MIAILTYNDTCFTQSKNVSEIKICSSNGTTFSVKEENGNLVITNK